LYSASPLAAANTVPAQDVAETLARAPEDLVELQLSQLQRLPNGRPRLFPKVKPFQYFPVTLLG